MHFALVVSVCFCIMLSYFKALHFNRSFKNTKHTFTQGSFSHWTTAELSANAVLDRIFNGTKIETLFLNHLPTYWPSLAITANRYIMRLMLCALYITLEQLFSSPSDPPTVTGLQSPVNQNLLLQDDWFLSCTMQLNRSLSLWIFNSDDDKARWWWGRRGREWLQNDLHFVNSTGRPIAGLISRRQL